MPPTPKTASSKSKLAAPAGKRLTIPSAWRRPHTEEDTFLAIQHPDGCIAVLPPERVNKLLADLDDPEKFTAEEAKDFRTDTFPNAQSFTFDQQGRFSISDALLAYAGIKEDSVLKFTGMGETFHIMTVARWKQRGSARPRQNQGEMITRLRL